VTGVGAVAHRPAERPHPVEHPVHLAHHVAAVDHQAGTPLGAQRHVEDGTVLGGVDVLPREHGVDPLPQAGPVGQGHQEPEGLGRDPLLGRVEGQAVVIDGQRRGASRVGGEQVPQAWPRWPRPPRARAAPPTRAWS